MYPSILKPGAYPHEEHSPAEAEQSEGRSFDPCRAVRWSVKSSSTEYGLTNLEGTQLPKISVPPSAPLSCRYKDHWPERARTF